MNYKNLTKVNFPTDFIKDLQIYLGRSILYWDYRPGDINVKVNKSLLIEHKKVIYVPCRYKMRILRIENWL